MTLAVIMSQARWAERSFYPYLVALQAIPILAIVPIILSVFGTGMQPRLFVCVMISFFPIVTNTLFGLQLGRRRPARPVHAPRRLAMDPAVQAAAPGRPAGDLHRLPHLRRPLRHRRRRRRAVLPAAATSRVSAS